MMIKRHFMVKVLLLLFLLGLTSQGSAGDDPLKVLVDETLSLFRPVEGRILQKKDSYVTVNRGSKHGVVRGMRLEALRKVAPFRHPVTGELIGETEVVVATLEVIEVKEETSECRVIKGEPDINDRIRNRKARRRILFYQDEGVDYYLAEAYHRRLKDTGMFELIDAPIEPLSEASLIKMAREKNAEALISLTAQSEAGRVILKQRLLWSDGSKASKEETVIPIQLISRLREEAGFVSVAEEPLLTFRLPYGAENFTIADIDGDSVKELVFSTGTDIYFYSYDVSLHQEGHVKGKKVEEIIWLDSANLKSEGRDEIIVTTITDDRQEVKSYIYTPVSLPDGSTGLEKIWQTEGFLRVLDRRILFQEYSPTDGYKGPIKEVEYRDGEFRIVPLSFTVPPIFNIYDFVRLKDSQDRPYYIYIDDEGILSLVNPEGVQLWRSGIRITGSRRSYDRESFAVMVERGKWYVKDRIISTGKEAFVVLKEPLVEKAKTLGYKKSQVYLVWVTNGALQQSLLIDNIPGELLDFALYRGKLIVLSKPLLGLKVENILKGENPFLTYLQVYSVKIGG